ncbi:MAG: T9SS type A sorting domain-containing protein [Bacteroidetes bacterium]|nr:T9SS C-terminal target domain-containing protein [Bacteroidota bacterium]MBV6461073.1 hypothetical protein [Flavobacteriales bacterium]WKZ75530.1 MAG: T9SS type A sorting domain-containing protein [Vicingaceae bacterium]MCL4815096.1 T9SS type A sorting domain-containing protein [Flavobacteriales bacterium]NOG94797.1 T9SS type A sorting domain-containing protein [Bacteroidota bacterium]
MNKFLLFLGLITGISLQAQPTLTNANMVPSIGETYTYYVADSLANPGGSGANITWDFSTLKGYAVPTETIYIVNPALTPQGPVYFGSSQFADTSAGKNITYYTANSNEMINKGYVFVNPYTGSSVIEWDINDEKIMQFPFTYSTSFNDNYSGTLHYTVLGTPLTAAISGSVNVQGDGHGTLMLPFSVTLSNVLRVVTTENASANIPGFGPVNISSTIYSFYEPGTSKYPILRIINSTLNGTQSNMAYCKYPLNAGASVTENGAFHNISLFPNPANQHTQLSFYSSKSNTAHILLKNILGQKVSTVFSGTLNAGNNTFTIETEQLKSGIYFITIENSESLKTIKLRIE